MLELSPAREGDPIWAVQLCLNFVLRDVIPGLVLGDMGGDSHLQQPHLVTVGNDIRQVRSLIRCV